MFALQRLLPDKLDVIKQKQVNKLKKKKKCSILPDKLLNDFQRGEIFCQIYTFLFIFLFKFNRHFFHHADFVH